MVKRAVTWAWRSKKIRFLFTGGFNTMVSYLLWCGLYYLLGHRFHENVVTTLSTMISINVSYTTFKTVVFKTKRNFLREYFRFYLVYLPTFCISMVCIPFLIRVVHMNGYIAMAVVTAITVIISWFGHEHISFRVKKHSPASAQPEPVMELARRD